MGKMPVWRHGCVRQLNIGKKENDFDAVRPVSSKSIRFHTHTQGWHTVIQSHRTVCGVVTLLSSPDKKTMPFHIIRSLFGCGQQFVENILRACECVSVLFAGAQKCKTFHFKAVLLSANDTLWIKCKRNFRSVCEIMRCNIYVNRCWFYWEFSATVKRLGLGRAAYLLV